MTCHARTKLGSLLPGIAGPDLERLALLPCLDGITDLIALPGGITNRNYKAVTPWGAFVVRLSDEGSSLLAIDRVHEHRNSLAAAYAGARVCVEKQERRRTPGRGCVCS